MFITIDIPLRTLPSIPDGAVALISYRHASVRSHEYIWLMSNDTKLRTYVWDLLMFITTYINLRRVAEPPEGAVAHLHYTHVPATRLRGSRHTDHWLMPSGRQRVTHVWEEDYEYQTEMSILVPIAYEWHKKDLMFIVTQPDILLVAIGKSEKLHSHARFVGTVQDEDGRWYTIFDYDILGLGAKTHLYHDVYFGEDFHKHPYGMDYEQVKGHWVATCS